MEKRARGSTGGALSPSRAPSGVLANVLALQRDRWILWLPVSVIAGAALWLSLPTDPPPWLPGGLFLFGLGVFVAIYIAAASVESGVAATLRMALLSMSALVAGIGLGMAAAQVRTALVAAPAYVGSAEPVEVEGWVISIDPSDRGPRLRLIVRAIEGNNEPPRYVRVAVPHAGMLTPGRAARCLAVLGPPSGAMAPGAYDFARRAFFEQLGASGFGMGRCRPAAFEPPPSWFDRQMLRLAALRWDLSAAIQASSPGRGGAIAAALVSGDRSAVDKETNDALRDSGLGHLLSVSGIHMGVVGGLVFAALMWTLALIAPLALRWPVKKLAAIGALAALAAYLVISGSSVPALRSFVMACVAFGAILLDRPAISMRGLALAALIVTLIFPESVLEPGFQMSFAATMALVALFEMSVRPAGEPALPTPGPLIGVLQWGSRSIGGVILISLVAGLATDPFAIYHFQRFSTYALPANLIAAPIMSFLVAPAAGVAAVLAPFGLADPALQIMSSSLDLIAAIGETFGVRPEAVRALSRPPDGAFVLCVLALLWASLWRGGMRWGGLVFLTASLGLYVTESQPIVAFDADLRAVFVKSDEGAGARWTLIAKPGRSTYARDRLGAMLGLSPANLERLAAPEACGETICTPHSENGAALFLVRGGAGFDEACRAGAVVVAVSAAPPGYVERCGLAALIDAPDRARLGGALIYEAESDMRIERAWPPHIRRAWTPALGGDAETQE